MAKPQILQNLQHDKALTQANFPTFVETFNYIVNRLENIKGDKDINDDNGHITFDTSDPEHPVIRIDENYNSIGNIVLSNNVSSLSSEISIINNNITIISSAISNIQPQVSGYTGNISNIISIGLTSDNVFGDYFQATRLELCYQNGLLTAVNNIDPLRLLAEKYNNV